MVKLIDLSVTQGRCRRVRRARDGGGHRSLAADPECPKRPPKSLARQWAPCSRRRCVSPSESKKPVKNSYQQGFGGGTVRPPRKG
jgi:hypothetical protein